MIKNNLSGKSITDPWTVTYAESDQIMGIGWT